MIAAEVASKVCKDIVRRVGQRGERTFLVTSFTYPDGDFINLYFRKNDGVVWATDLGGTIEKLQGAGIELTTARARTIRHVCNLHRVELAEDEIIKPLVMENPGVDCVTMCEAIGQIASLVYDSSDHAAFSLREQVESVMKTRVAPFRHIERHWTHPEADLGKAFPVDYHIGGLDKPCNLFYIASAGKSNLVAAVCNFLKVKNAYNPSMAIIHPSANLGKKHLHRLKMATTAIKFGVPDNEEAIARFALAAA